MQQSFSNVLLCNNTAKFIFLFQSFYQCNNIRCKSQGSGFGNKCISGSRYMERLQHISNRRCDIHHSGSIQQHRLWCCSHQRRRQLCLRRDSSRNSHAQHRLCLCQLDGKRGSGIHLGRIRFYSHSKPSVGSQLRTRVSNHCRSRS